MRVLVIGGSGHVGSLVVPFLREKHDLTIFDLHAPADQTIPHRIGSLGDYPALVDACAEQEALIFMAMGQSMWKPGADAAERARAQGDAFDVNIKGVYFALLAAHQAGITHAVYTSSMSVYHSIDYRREERRYFVDEEMPPDARNVYGFTKRIGEEVCRNAARDWEMDVNALRLCLPIADEAYRQEVKADEPNIKTAASDVARALLAALEFRAGFQAFMISGDYEEKLMRLAKARRLLNWEPLARPAA